jgi:hypothetical protein
VPTGSSYVFVAALVRFPSDAPTRALSIGATDNCASRVDLRYPGPRMTSACESATARADIRGGFHLVVFERGGTSPFNWTNELDSLPLATGLLGNVSTATAAGPVVLGGSGAVDVAVISVWSTRPASVPLNSWLSQYLSRVARKLPLCTS